MYRWGLGLYRTSLVYALQNWLSESPDQAARKPGSNPGILGVAMALMAVFIVCLSLFPSSPPSLIFPNSIYLFSFFFDKKFSRSLQPAGKPIKTSMMVVMMMMMMIIGPAGAGRFFKDGWG